MLVLRNIAVSISLMLVSSFVAFAQSGEDSVAELRKVRESFVAATLDSCSPSDEEIIEIFRGFSKILEKSRKIC